MTEPKQSDSVFWIENGKIRPNPYQPRKEFDQRALEDLADSIRQYGILQPLTVTRHEEQSEEGMQVYYELIAGERRLRASKLAGLDHVPAIIRTGEETDKMKLELAIIENLQREDLNPIDKARAFKKLTEEFGLTHAAIGKRMGKSREYVSNALRLLSLPEYVQQAVGAGKISEGHARPLMMLRDQPDERDTLFKEILYKKMSVRDAEKIARSIAKDKVRKVLSYDPEVIEYEKKFSENLGTRVSIEKQKKGDGGKIVINYFSTEDLASILEMLESDAKKGKTEMLNRYIESKQEGEDVTVIAETSKENMEVAPSVEENNKKGNKSSEPVVEGKEKDIDFKTREVTAEETKKEAASLDDIFGADSSMAFDIKESGVKEEKALGYDFEDEEEDEDMDNYYAELMFGNRISKSTDAEVSDSGTIPKKISEDGSNDLGETLGALDSVTSHDIKEEL